MLSSEPSDNFSGHRFSLLEAERVVLNVANNLQFLWAHMFFVLGKVFYFQLGKGLCSLTSWGSPTASLGKCSLYYGLLSQQNTLPMQLPLVLWKEFYQKITCSLSHIYGINYKYKRKTHTHTHPELSGLRPSFNLKHSYFWMPLFNHLILGWFPPSLPFLPSHSPSPLPSPLFPSLPLPSLSLSLSLWLSVQFVLVVYFQPISKIQFP